MVAPVNDVIAGKLREMADVLEQQRADGFRIATYRRAADTLEMLRQPVEDIVRMEGLPGLVELPSIGRGIGSAIVEMVTTGRWSQLERLQGELQPEHLFQALPGIGPELAARIHDALHVDTLEKTKDWVVIYFHLDSEPESQCTVVTETRGPLVGRRIVRGREGECAVHYAEAPSIAQASPAGVGPDVKASHRSADKHCAEP
jgi:hypothetical protein